MMIFGEAVTKANQNKIKKELKMLLHKKVGYK
jgi:hypothetical protein